MCRKNGNPKHKDDHIPAKQGVSNLSRLVEFIFNYESNARSYNALAQELLNREYSLKTFYKYWKGRPLTGRMMMKLEETYDFLQKAEKKILMRDEKLEALLA